MKLSLQDLPEPQNIHLGRFRLVSKMALLVAITASAAAAQSGRSAYRQQDDELRERAQQAIWHAQSRQRRDRAPAVKKRPATPRQRHRPPAAQRRRPAYRNRHVRLTSGQEPIPTPNPGATYETYHEPPMEMHGPEMWFDEHHPAFSEGVIQGGEFIEGDFIDGGCINGDCLGGCGGICGCDCSNCTRVGSPRTGRPSRGAGVLGSGDLGFELGVQGFTGPANLGVSNSFGFHQSVNFGMGAFRNIGIGWQIGVRTLQSNLSGAQFSDANRNQTFLTTGLFRRQRRCGWQWGFAVDLLSDDWYDESTLRQVRGEIGRRISQCTDWGYAFSFGGDEDTTRRPNIPTARPPGTTLDVWEPLDWHTLYFRSQLRAVPGSNLRAFVGFSGESDGLLGVDTRLPIGRYWALRSGFTYLIPEQSSAEGGFENEAWNVSIALTWNYGGNGCKSQYAPLFDVADNGSFIIDRVSAR